MTAGSVTNTGIISMPTERKYLPTFAELCDRLSIVLLKSIFIPENRDAYREEMSLIEHDLNECFLTLPDMRLSALSLRAIMIIMLANRTIWQGEAAARAGTGGETNLRLSHAINGVRNTAKNVLAIQMGARVDLKIDCLAADLLKEVGSNWNIFE